MSWIDAAAELNAFCACPAALTIPVADADRALLRPPCMFPERLGSWGTRDVRGFDASEDDVV
jgi:hypothetical protein